MELKSMTFTPGSDGDVVPETVTVTMTTNEALWIALVSQRQRGESPHNGISDCLSNDVFNRYWEDGVGEARRSFHVDIPPIVYND